MKFTAEYYRSGNYLNYLNRRFTTLAADMIEVLRLTSDTRIVDFGCGCGGLVDALASAGCGNIIGTDVSMWAIDHGKLVFPGVADRLQHYNRNLLVTSHERLIMLDVMEHMPEYEAESILRLARCGLDGMAAFRIPIAATEGQPFALAVSNNDPTHINCHGREWWHDMLSSCGFAFLHEINAESIYASEGVLAEVWK